MKERLRLDIRFALPTTFADGTVAVPLMNVFADHWQVDEVKCSGAYFIAAIK